ncbi:MAG: hypothetical protein COB01_06900 [Lutibacter sp.]|nr:MAG: hypothetical protein COB01_06900 [Lutibacter sp.]
MKADKNIEDFTKFMMKEATVEMPSENFVTKVMNTIQVESIPALKENKPLITVAGWVIISLFFVTICTLVLFGTYESPSLISNLDWSFMNELPSLSIIDRIHFSSTFNFSFILFSILVILQLVVIKNYVNKENRTL